MNDIVDTDYTDDIEIKNETTMNIDIIKIKQIIEAILLSSTKALTEKQLLAFFPENEIPPIAEFRSAIKAIQEDCELRGVELVKVASGYQMQSKQEFAPYIAKMWEEKPAKYSRALFETLALIAYRQPITRGEIEEIRGVSISPSIFKTLGEDRGWIRVVGHRDVPGRPGLYATTKEFLDYFGLSSLENLPSISEVLETAEANLQLELQEAGSSDEHNQAQTEKEQTEIFAEDESDIIDNEEVNNLSEGLENSYDFEKEELEENNLEYDDAPESYDDNDEIISQDNEFIDHEVEGNNKETINNFDDFSEKVLEVNADEEETDGINREIDSEVSIKSLSDIANKFNKKSKD